MPHRRIVRPWLEFVGKHDTVILFLLLVVTVFLAVFAAIGWNKARNAQRRLTTVEATQAAEVLGKKIADTTSCFNRAYGRPGLIIVLRGIAVKLDPDPRQAVLELIDRYERDTPSVGDCVTLARKNGIDPKPYLRNPPSEAGNVQTR